MDPCLHLALLEAWDDSDLVMDVLDLPAVDRRPHYAGLLAETISPDTPDARWTHDEELFHALPEGADDTIRSLAGIEAYPEIQVLYLTESQVDDLSPLAELPKLEALCVGVNNDTDLTPLLACPKLGRVHIETGFPDRAVLKTLAARGVQVDDLLPGPAETTAPFTDPILKLAVLEAVRPSIELPKMYHFHDGWDDDNLNRLLAIEISQEQLDSIETLYWGAVSGRQTAHMVWPGWDGESDEFLIRSLKGLEALRNLRKLDVALAEVLPADQLAALEARGVTAV